MRVRPLGECGPEYKRLEAKLLAIGGSRVIHQDGGEGREDPFIKRLPEDGRRFSKRGFRREPGQPNRCHHNAAVGYVQSDASLQIGTGFGPRSDGIWSRHSWLLRGRTIVETTFEFLVYFGVALTASEASSFVFGETVVPLPGFGEFASDVKERARKA
jgi:hypothetical protein